MNSLLTFLTTTGGLALPLARKIQRAMLILALGIIAIVFASIVLSPVFREGAIIGGLLLVCMIFILLWAGIITPELLLGVFAISLPAGSGWAARVAAILERLYRMLLSIVTYLGILPLMLLFVANAGENVQGAIIAYIIGGGIGILALEKGSSGTIALNLGLSIGISYVVAYIVTPTFLPIGWVMYPIAFIVFCLFENIKLTGKKILGLLLLALLWYGALWLFRPDIATPPLAAIAKRHGYPAPPKKVVPPVEIRYVLSSPKPKKECGFLPGNYRVEIPQREFFLQLDKGGEVVQIKKFTAHGTDAVPDIYPNAPHPDGDSSWVVTMNYAIDGETMDIDASGCVVIVPNVDPKGLKGITLPIPLNLKLRLIHTD